MARLKAWGDGFIARLKVKMQSLPLWTLFLRNLFLQTLFIPILLLRSAPAQDPNEAQETRSQPDEDSTSHDEDSIYSYDEDELEARVALGVHSWLRRGGDKEFDERFNENFKVRDAWWIKQHGYDMD